MCSLFDVDASSGFVEVNWEAFSMAALRTFGISGEDPISIGGGEFGDDEFSDVDLFELS